MSETAAQALEAFVDACSRRRTQSGCGRQKREGGQVRVELAEGMLKISDQAPHFVDLDRVLGRLDEEDPVCGQVVSGSSTAVCPPLNRL